MPISVPGILLSKFTLDQEPIPEERRRQLMLVGGAAPFPLGVVIAQLVARREAETPTNVVGTDTGSTDKDGREAAAASAAREAIAASEAAKSARASAEATQAAADQAARAAGQADEAARDALAAARALQEEWEAEEEETTKQS